MINYISAEMDHQRRNRSPASCVQLTQRGRADFLQDALYSQQVGRGVDAVDAMAGMGTMMFMMMLMTASACKGKALQAAVAMTAAWNAVYENDVAGINLQEYSIQVLQRHNDRVLKRFCVCVASPAGAASDA
jgi:hypothetical protein